MEEQTLKHFESIDFNKLQHSSIISTQEDDEKVLALLKIRGKQYTLLFYDYYMLTAIEITDIFDDSQVDFKYVSSLRHAIREDQNHFMGAMFEIMYSYKGYSLSALDKIISIYDEYLDAGCSSDSEIFNLDKKLFELDYVLESVNKT